MELRGDLDEAPAVRQAGQRIVEGEPVRLALRRPQHGDILDREGQAGLRLGIQRGALDADVTYPPCWSHPVRLLVEFRQSASFLSHLNRIKIDRFLV